MTFVGNFFFLATRLLTKYFINRQYSHDQLLTTQTPVSSRPGFEPRRTAVERVSSTKYSHIGLLHF